MKEIVIAIVGFIATIGAALIGLIPGCSKDTGPTSTPTAIVTSSTTSTSAVIEGKAFDGDWVEQIFNGGKGRAFHWIIKVESGKLTGHTIDTGDVEHTLQANLTTETTFSGLIQRTKPGVSGDVATANVKAQLLPSGSFEWEVTWTKSSAGEVKVGDTEKSEFWKKQ